MKNRLFALVLALVMALSLFGCGQKPAADDTGDAPETVTVTDMIGRELELTPGSYQRVVCIGAGALRLYSYVGDVSLLCGVEDIDNTTLSERPQMFDGVARPYVMVYGDTFAALPSCGVGGPNAQAAEAEKILSCTPDIIVSEYEDTDKADALQQRHREVRGLVGQARQAQTGGAQGRQALGNARIHRRVLAVDGQVVALVADPRLGVHRINFDSTLRLLHGRQHMVEH